MADSAYYHLERMLPELDDLKERGLFSEAEVKEIARRRREFEFRLERRSKLKEDYISYINYELQLEKLRLLRKKALVRKLQGSKGRWQPSLCDRASAMRIMLIYERATTRFKGDLELWMQYLSYCRSQGTRRMQKVLTKVLRLHPTVPGLWIYAAAWEFERNAMIVSARALMQRGLRVCPSSEKLWLEYFRMELVYTERLRAKNINPVGRNGHAKDDPNGHSKEEADYELILKMDDDEEEEIKMTPKEQEVGMDGAKVDELAYRLASTIYKNAVTALPSKLQFRKSFLDVLQNANFSRASLLQDEILRSLERDFPMDTGCWDWQARVRYKITGESNEAIKVYEKALGVVSTADMYELYSCFLEELSGLGYLDHEAMLKNPEERLQAARHLLNLYNRAKECGVISSHLAEGHVMVLLRLGKQDAALQALEGFCLGQFKSSARLWALRIMLAIKAERISESHLSRVADLFEQGLKHVLIGEAGELWGMVLEYFGGQKTVYDRLLDILIFKLAGSSGDEVSASLACSLIDWVLSIKDIKHARRVYDRILALPWSSIHVYKLCIKIECQMAAMGCTKASECMRRLFEGAIEKSSQDSELWLEYCSQELKAGHLDVAGSVYWRAKKTLRDPTAFLEGHQRLKSIRT